MTAPDLASCALTLPAGGVSSYGDRCRTEADFKNAVDQFVAGVGRADTLLALLDERHPCYEDKGAAAIARMRGWALLALAHGPSPWPEARDLVVEELESGIAPYLIAAAARVLSHVCVSADARLEAPLNAASETVARHDAWLDLSRWGGTALPGQRKTPELRAQRFLPGVPPAATTASAEVARAREWFDTARARSVVSNAPDGGWGRYELHAAAKLELEEVILEDHSGGRVRAADLFRGGPTFVVFFYTRCDNPRKCSMTISRLRDVQVSLRRAQLAGCVRTAAITYDPLFDHSERLRGFVESRGMHLEEGHRALRVVEGGAELQRAFDVGVGFLSTVVNRHRIEAHLIDASGRRRITYHRLMWRVDQVLDDIHALVSQEISPAAPASVRGVVQADHAAADKRLRSRLRHRVGAGLAPVWALALALFPKCPVCGVGYLSLTGMTVLPQLPGWYWTWPLLALALVMNLGALALLARRRRRWGALLLGAIALAILFGPGVTGGSQVALLIGVLVSLAASLYSVAVGPPPVRRARSEQVVGERGSGMLSQTQIEKTR